jgi:hypothetical protein
MDADMAITLTLRALVDRHPLAVQDPVNCNMTSLLRFPAASWPNNQYSEVTMNRPRLPACVQVMIIALAGSSR